MKHQDKRKNTTPPSARSHCDKEQPHLGHLKTQEVVIETSNPYFQPTHLESSNNPRTIKAIVNAGSRPIALLYAKGHISKAQYRAAERFYVYWRQSQSDLHMSPDYTRPKIACGQSYTHPIERQIEASNHLQKVKVLLGILGYSLIEQVVGYGQAIKDLNPSKRKQNSLADHLRDCLELLACHWGYTSG
ncbi:hypothetical protein BHOIPH791_13560 [Bartonella henselae]|uniref:Uncharacterized protein n=3 Tax=root TaxID=1 RepID=X5MIA6_BARHN|nr:hypothetical protein [Bartonella henselae]DBA12286.1 TPA_asm: hypothetical protein [Bartonegtaviriform andersoni]ATP12878.1 hypothetical protein BhenCHDE101_07460 [Bartonella henselae]ETS05892.1 hypothetical protein Q654_01439 [Bartonella henselae JK 50]ETS06063.1 hypothetical protein Q655_01387 [Bartonella henselae JK 51]ETS10940.1 hypothetical protein Q653_00463 [Bartonella henselae JK 42]